MYAVLDMLPAPEGGSILDLGTGNGNLAFPLAAQYPHVQVTGLDIAENAIAHADASAREQGLSNLHFSAYDGLHFPFGEDAFDLVVTRYALHHFPQLDDTLAALHALLRPGGRILVADPMAHPADSRFLIDDLMAVKADGHVHFYTNEELVAAFARHSFGIDRQIITHMRYPFPRREAYNVLYAQATETERALYQLHERGGVVWVGQIDVGNTLFIRK